MALHLKIVGYLLLALSLLHAIIPGYFKWKTELSTLSLISRQIMYVHTFFIAFIVLLFGVLCIGYSHELQETSFGRVISLGLFLFWFTRLLFQFFVYSPSVWKGKQPETFVHVIFSVLWFYISGVFLLAYLGYNSI